MKSPPKLNHVAIKTSDEYCSVELRMQDLLVTVEGLIFDSLDNNLVGLWNKHFDLQRYYKGLLSDLPGSYHIVPVSGNKLLLSCENLLYLIDLEDGSRKEIWNCH